MRIEVGTLVWEDGKVTGGQADLFVFQSHADAWAGQSVRLPEAGSVRCDPRDPWGFYALAVGAGLGPVTVVGELPARGEEPEDSDAPVVY